MIQILSKFLSSKAIALLIALIVIGFLLALGVQALIAGTDTLDEHNRIILQKLEESERLA